MSCSHFCGMAQLPPVNPLCATYWTMGAVRHGDHVAKVRFAPVGTFADAVEHREVDLWSDPDAYRRALEVELKERPFEFDLQVQLCTDLEQMPVQDVTVEWQEALSPFVTVAKVRLPSQDISGAGQPRTNGCVVLHPLAGQGRACAARRDPASATRGVPALLDHTPPAERSGATRAAQRVRGARRGASHLGEPGRGVLDGYPSWPDQGRGRRFGGIAVATCVRR